MKTVNIHEAKTTLSKLLELVQQGELVVIAKAGVPVADLRPHKVSKPTIVFGTLKGKVHYDDAAFDRPDPDIQKMFYGESFDDKESDAPTASR